MRKYRIITNGKRFKVEKKIEYESRWQEWLLGGWFTIVAHGKALTFETFEEANKIMQRWKDQDDDTERTWSVCETAPEKQGQQK